MSTARFLSVAEVAEELGCTVAQAYPRVRRMTHLRIGRILRVSRSVLRAWRAPQRGKAPPKGPCVYFVMATDAIKIGYSDDVGRRLRQLCGASPIPLILVAWRADADRETEAELHRRFRADRMHGEWFRPSAALLEYVIPSAERSP